MNPIVKSDINVFVAGFFLMSRLVNSTGRLLLTKDIHTFQPVDITANYKVIRLEPHSTGAKPVMADLGQVLSFHIDTDITNETVY
jgi:hypothetical protein